MDMPMLILYGLLLVVYVSVLAFWTRRRGDRIVMTIVFIAAITLPAFLGFMMGWYSK